MKITIEAEEGDKPFEPIKVSKAVQFAICATHLTPGGFRTPFRRSSTDDFNEQLGSLYALTLGIEDLKAENRK